MLSRTTVWASAFCATAAYPHLVRSENGRLILMSSPSGIEGSHNIPTYSPVKGAQRAMVKSLAREWGPDGITVNAIAPVALTERHDPYQVVEQESTLVNPVYHDRITRRTSLGHLRDGRDIASSVAFLASDAGRYVTGQTIVCDGGGFVGL